MALRFICIPYSRDDRLLSLDTPRSMYPGSSLPWHTEAPPRDPQELTSPSVVCNHTPRKPQPRLQSQLSSDSPARRGFSATMSCGRLFGWWIWSEYQDRSPWLSRKMVYNSNDQITNQMEDNPVDGSTQVHPNPWCDIQERRRSARCAGLRPVSDSVTPKHWIFHDRTTRLRQRVRSRSYRWELLHRLMSERFPSSLMWRPGTLIPSQPTYM